MIRHQRAYFQTRSPSGPPEHPAGEGWRDVLVFPAETEGYVTVLSVPLMVAKDFAETAWRAIKPLDADSEPARDLERVRRAMADLTRQGIAFEREVAERAVTYLLCAVAPAPRARTRERLNPPVPSVEGQHVADDGVRAIATGDVHS